MSIRVIGVRNLTSKGALQKFYNSGWVPIQPTFPYIHVIFFIDLP